MFGGSAPTPQVPALPDPLPSAPTYASGSGAKPLGWANRPGTTGSTIMTSPFGDTTTPALGKKSLLGQ
jgi:hypothetical protein